MSREIILFFIFAGAGFLGTGIFIGKHVSAPAETIDSIQVRLSALEKKNSMIVPKVEREPEMPQYRMNSFEEQLNEIEQEIHARLNKMEKTLQNYSADRYSNESQTAGEGKSPIVNEQLQTGFDLLDQAATNGVLDETTHAELDEIIETMDPETNQRFWERMFADLQAGRYVLPDDELADDHVLLPDGEVEEKY